MMTISPEQGFRYLAGAAFVALGTYLCFAPKEQLFIKMGSTGPPQGAKPIPRLVSSIMALGFAIAGADLILYKFVDSKFPNLTPDRQALFVGALVMLTWGLGSLFAGLNARPGSTIDVRSVGYRQSAFLGAFALLVFALFLAYLALAARH